MASWARAPTSPSSVPKCCRSGPKTTVSHRISQSTCVGCLGLWKNNGRGKRESVRPSSAMQTLEHRHAGRLSSAYWMSHKICPRWRTLSSARPTTQSKVLCPKRLEANRGVHMVLSPTWKAPGQSPRPGRAPDRKIISTICVTPGLVSANCGHS